MKIILRPHLKIRLKERDIPKNYPKDIVTKPEALYIDILTKHSIAIKKMEYNEKLRFMAVSYDIIKKTLQVITIHPISEREIQNKLKRGRWIKNEEN